MNGFTCVGHATFRNTEQRIIVQCLLLLLLLLSFYSRYAIWFIALPNPTLPSQANLVLELIHEAGELLLDRALPLAEPQLHGIQDVVQVLHLLLVTAQHQLSGGVERKSGGRKGGGGGREGGGGGGSRHREKDRGCVKNIRACIMCCSFLAVAACSPVVVTLSPLSVKLALQGLQLSLVRLLQSPAPLGLELYEGQKKGIILRIICTIVSGSIHQPQSLQV